MAVEFAVTIGEKSGGEEAAIVALQELQQAVERTDGWRVLNREPLPGEKGITESLIIEPTGAILVLGLVRIVDQWLRRDRHRHIEIKGKTRGGEPISISVNGDNVSLQLLELAIRKTLDVPTDAKASSTEQAEE